MRLELKSGLDTPSPLYRNLSYTELALLEDEVLMGHLLNGHYDALAVLFDRYHRLVLNIALRILRDVGEAEDLMQSVFLEIFRAAAQFDPTKGSTKVWILQYAYHRSFDRRQYLTLRGIYERPQESVPIGSAAAETSSLESALALQEAFGHLNKMQRKTLELAFYEGLTMHQIAGTTGESYDSVRHHYYRGLKKLRSILYEAPRARMNTSQERGEAAHVRP
jgi:RNA polymerase sigma-70 factor (ECF subfamily)